VPIASDRRGEQSLFGEKKTENKFLEQLKPYLENEKYSKIGFNMHGEVAGDYAANVRLFEITGVGSCMVTDWKKNLNEIFEIDKEAVAFSSGDECIEKIKWLLDHPKEREEIAIAGQKRVLRDHTFKIRASQLNEIILKELKK